METKKITEAMREQLGAPLPPEAVSPHPTKKFLSSIKSIYVTERLNEVFGVGSWKLFTEFVEKVDKMVVVKTTFRIPEYNVDFECFGGNDNSDLGDAYKGATTDALTKIASWLGIGREVFKGGVKQNTHKPQQTFNRKVLTTDDILDQGLLSKLCLWIHGKIGSGSVAEVLNKYYDCDDETIDNITYEYNRTYGSN